MTTGGHTVAPPNPELRAEPAVGDAEAGLPPLRLISTLCQQLRAADVSYCHWKSTEGLRRSSRGENDLDLLVARSDVARFIEVLQRLGFKEGRFPGRKEHPGITNYFGLDDATGRLVHVHAHYQLVLGDDASKNYRIPVEEAYLSSAVQGSLFREPSPDFEFVLLLVRMILKHGTWDALFGFRGGLSLTERRELAYLATRANGAAVASVLGQHFPTISVQLFDQCVRSLQPGCPLGFRLRVGRRLERALSVHARRTSAIDRTLKVWRRASGKLRRVFAGRPVRARLSTGGALIAVVGGDGAGKTTVVRELVAWLSRHVLVERVHLGKPPVSPERLAVKGMSAIQRLRRRSQRLSAGTPELETPSRMGYITLFRHVLTARDRHRAHVRARRLAVNGWVVLCDRYPLHELKLMDGPQLASIERSTSGLGRIRRRLAELERRYYRSMTPPDLLLVLRVDPDSAVRRRPEGHPEVVRARSREVWDLDWEGRQARVIDANLPKTQVLSRAKSIVWSSL